MERIFDVLVIGGGHAGVEASYMASRWENLQVALVSMPDVPIASAPCNPSVGGVAKGQVVREIDAMGGLMGLMADKAAIQYRTLNDSKGHAVQSTRVQIDKERYSANVTAFLKTIPNLTLILAKVGLVYRKEALFCVDLEDERGEKAFSLCARRIVVTTGTFLNGKLHCGEEQKVGGRVDCASAKSFKDLFAEVSMNPLRFKTGTPPRLKRESLDFDRMEAQPSDEMTRNFHCLHVSTERFLPQVSCYLTRTNPKTLEIIRNNRARSPLFNGQIQGVGPRYCPSIEDKAYRYPDRDIHHLFIEPEGLDIDSFYPNGISTSLPVDVQEAFVKSVVGLEKAEILVPGYAVEYDVVDTTHLNHSLEYQEIKGLYFAGQVNGTSGYEEAAGQGLVAGINAALSVLGKEPLIFSRHHSYIGVMVEDLISNRRDEPYRLFTARSENRLLLREDNTLLRMAPYRKQLALSYEIDRFHELFREQFDLLFSLVKKASFLEELKNPKNNPVTFLQERLLASKLLFQEDVIRCVAVSAKYEGYIKRSEEQNRRMEQMDSMKINWMLLAESTNVSFECRQRILAVRPETFGQLRLIEGIRAATLAIAAGKLY